MKYFSYNGLLRYVKWVIVSVIFFLRKRVGLQRGERKNIKGCIKTAEPSTPKKVSTLAHMIFDPPLDLNKIIEEGNASKFKSNEEWSDFIHKKIWDYAI